jgi:hypothetical protein
MRPSKSATPMKVATSFVLDILLCCWILSFRATPASFSDLLRDPGLLEVNHPNHDHAEDLSLQQARQLLPSVIGKNTRSAYSGKLPPEDVRSSNPGDVYLQDDGSNLELWVKESYLDSTNGWHLLGSVVTTGVVSTRKYGAKGDGVTDDTRSIQLALTEAAAKGEELRFSKGTFKISSELVLFGTNVTIQGDGATLMSGFTNKFDTPLLGVGGENIRVSGLRINGNGLNSKGIGVIGTPGGITATVRVDNNELFGFSRSNWLSAAISVSAYRSSSSITNVLLEFNNIHDCTNVSGISFWADPGLSVSGLSVQHNKVFNLTGKAFVADQRSFQGTFFDNQVERTDGGIHLESTHDWRVIGNIITSTFDSSSAVGVPGNGITVYLCKDIFLSDNVIGGGPTNRSAIYLPGQQRTKTGSGNVSIRGVHTYGFQYGVYAEYPTNLIIESGLFQFPGRNGICINSGTFGGIRGNLILCPNCETNSGVNGAGVYISGSKLFRVDENICWDHRRSENMNAKPFPLSQGNGAPLMTYGIAERFGGIDNVVGDNTVVGANSAASLIETGLQQLNHGLLAPPTSDEKPTGDQ